MNDQSRLSTIWTRTLRPRVPSSVIARLRAAKHGRWRDVLSPDGELDRAAHAIADGGVIITPTGTVYGLVCDAENPRALARMRTLCGSPSSKPFTIVVEQSQVGRFAEVTPLQQDVVDSLLPAALTLFMKRRPGMLEHAICGYPQICFLWQEPEVADLHRKSGCALAITSANPAGLRPAATLAAAREYFPEGIAYCLGGGDNRAVEASAQLDISESPFKVLRGSLDAVPGAAEFLRARGVPVEYQRDN